MPDALEGETPIVRARVIRQLKDRPRLVDEGFREQLLENMVDNVEQRRTPSIIADRMSKETARSVADITEPVVRDAAAERFDQLNKTVFKNL